MFGMAKALPYIKGCELEDVSADLKSAEKIDDIRLGKKALYFYKDGKRYYIPFGQITGADAMVMHEHHSCCSGNSVMDVPKILVNYKDGQVFIPVGDKEAGEEVRERINEKISL